jgi:Zn-dependent protease with chaperone function
MITTRGYFCSGCDLRPQPVVLSFTPSGRLCVNGDGVDLDLNLADVRVSDRLGSIARFLYLPDGGTLETADNATIDAALAMQDRGRGAAFVHFLEQHTKIAAIATVCLVAAVLLGFKFGLPVLARHVASRMPVELELQAGRVALGTISRFLAPSNLSRFDQAATRTRLDRLLQVRPQRIPVQIEFYAMGPQYPNAFALPGGVIIVSDELVALADGEGELEAVLAHELGHLDHNHGVRSLLQSSFALLLVTAVTGDLSTLSTLAGTIPFLILQNGYARELELDADDYARELLLEARIDPKHFASILRKLEATRPSQGVDYSYLSTHPRTDERIRAFESVTSP